MPGNQSKHNNSIVEMSSHLSQQEVPKVQRSPKIEHSDGGDDIEKPPLHFPQSEDEHPSKSERSMELFDYSSMVPRVTEKIACSPKNEITLKPVANRYSITRSESDKWRTHNLEIFQQSNSKIYDAQVTISDAKQCVKQSYKAVDKAQLETTEHLKTRANIVYRWKTELEHAITGITEEIMLLEAERRRIQRSLSILTIPASITREFLQLRSSRLESDLVCDEVEEQLTKELALCFETLDSLNRAYEQIEIQMVELKTIKTRMESDWSDKVHTFKIDSSCINLSNNSSLTLWKPGATRFSTDQSTPASYEHFTREALTTSEIVKQKSVDLRSTLNTVYTNCIKNLNDQATRVDITLTKKVELTQDVLQQLERELLRCLYELANIEKLIEELRNSTKGLNNAMKLAQTRLNNRLNRRNIENCQDTPEIALIEEVKFLGERISAVLTELKYAEESQAKLVQTRGELEHEIMIKRKSLSIDKERGRLLLSFFPSTTALSGFS